MKQKPVDPHMYRDIIQGLTGKIKRLEPKDIEYLSEQVHKAYCNYCLDIKGKEYWTKGDYSLLSDKVKEADRYTVVAVLKGLRAIRDKIWGGDDGDK